jgi:hypothetical protein
MGFALRYRCARTALGWILRAKQEIEMLPTIAVPCPYCGERVELMIDESEGLQNYVEDCPVCCRPMEISVALDASGEVLVSATRGDA